MGLRGIKPELVQKRLKALFYGMAGVGKTTAAISFPKPYLIDCERGSENESYVRILNEKGGVVFNTTDFDELIKEVKLLLTEKHDFKTLIIDPLTILYDDLLEKSALKIKLSSKDKDATGTEFGRHYSEANKKMKHLLSLVLRLDMNVIIITHAKNEYIGDTMKVAGSTFDCYKKIDYLFDLVFEIQKRGKNVVGVIKKSRLDGFVTSENFPFSYDEIAERYGRSVLERDAISEKLATKDQVQRLTDLINLYKETPETVQKWLDKANAQSFDEMNESVILKIIDHMENKLNKREVTK